MRPIVAVSVGLTAVLGALPVGHVWLSVVPAAERDAETLRAGPAQTAAMVGGRLAAQAHDMLTGLAAREAERPWFHWQHLIADPRGLYDGEALVPSPLAVRPTEPLVFGYVQLDEHGQVSTPEIFDEGEAPPEAKERLELLSAALRPIEGHAEAPRVDSLENQVEWQVQRLDNTFYQQNMNVAEVAQQIRSKRARANVAEGQVVLRIGGFVWTSVTVGDESALLALRAVETPDGIRRQGFVVTWSALQAELRKVADTQAVATSLCQTNEPHGVAVPIALPIEGPNVSDWRVCVPLLREQTDVQAASLVADARMSAVVTTLLALLVAGLVIAVLLQSERLLARRQRFAAAAAHELRTPLASLRMYSEMLAHGLGRPEKQKLYAERLVSESARLGRVVSNVLDFTRLEKRSLALTPKNADIVPFLRDLVASLSPTLEAAGASLALEVPMVDDGQGTHDGELYACFDADALTQIVVNLVDNAEKYSRDADDRTITLAARHGGDRGREHIEVSVRDRGPGLPRRTARLFTPFSRGVGHDGPAGLGLGLTLSRALARAQGGDLFVARIDTGAELVVTLSTRAATHA